MNDALRVYDLKAYGLKAIDGDRLRVPSLVHEAALF